MPQIAAGNKSISESFVKARLCDPEEYLLCRMKGFEVFYETLSPEEVLKSLPINSSPSASVKDLFFDDAIDSFSLEPSTPLQRLMAAHSAKIREPRRSRVRPSA